MFDLIEGLRVTLEPSFFQTQKDQNIIFIGSEYCPIFLARWRKCFVQAHFVTFNYVDEETTLNFGNYNFFTPVAANFLWLAKISDFAKPEKFVGLKNMRLAFFCEELKLDKILAKFVNHEFLIIKIPKIISATLFLLLAEQLKIKFIPAREQIFKNWAKSFATLQLDAAVQICDYIELLSPSHKLLFNELSSNLSTAEQKFFILPELFFSGNWAEFFTLWDKVKSNFLPPFWTAFWLNAFYKAAAQQAGVASSVFARSLSRAANSRHFKSIAVMQLKNCIFKLYKLDHDFKQGLSAGDVTPILLEFC